MRTSSDHLILFALWLLIFASSSQIIIIAPILPIIGAELNIPEVLLGTLVTAYAATVGIFAVLMGPVSDKVGRKRMLLWGSGTMTIALALHGLATGYTSLLLVRAVAGASGGMLSGAAIAYIGDYFPYERRGWAAGWVMSGVAAGQILGIPLGTVLAEWFGFRIPFLMFAVVMGLSYLLIFRVVPHPRVVRAKGRLSFRSAARSYAELLRSREIVAANAVYFLMFLSLALYVVYLPTWLALELNVGGEEIALLFLVGGVASVLAGPIAGKFSDTTGRKPLIIASCLALAVVMPLTTWLIGGMVSAYLIYGFAMAMLAMRASPLQALLTALVSDARRGMLLSLAIALGQVGIGIGGALGGPLYTGAGFAVITYLASVVVVIMVWIVWRELPEPRHENSIGVR